MKKYDLYLVLGTSIGFLIGYIKTPCIRESLVYQCQFYPNYIILGCFVGFIVGYFVKRYFGRK